MKIVFMGTPEFAVESLDILVKSGIEICAVVTSSDKPAGRGLTLRKSAVKIYAESMKLPVLQPVKLKDIEFISQLKSFNADLFVVVAFRMLPEEVWQMPLIGTINLHASLLPQYRGAAPINWAIINGEKTTGLTTFFIEKEIDMGKIIFFEEVSIESHYNVGTLHDILMRKGAVLLLKTVESIKKGDFATMLQNEFVLPDQALKSAPKLTHENCKIDWFLKVEEIHNRIRGLSPYPGAWTIFKNILTEEEINVKIFKSEIVDGRHDSEAGIFITDCKNYLYVTADGGLLSILELQPEGRKKLSIIDYLRGFRGISDWQIKCKY
jgi:methionyl-tRNA formyltransferase